MNEMDLGAIIKRLEAAEEFTKAETAQLWKALLMLQDEIKKLKERCK